MQEIRLILFNPSPSLSGRPPAPAALAFFLSLLPPLGKNRRFSPFHPPKHRCERPHEHAAMVGAPFARLLANLVVMGTGVLGRAFVEAYKQALQSALSVCA